MVELVCVPPDRVNEFWPYTRHLILSAIRRTGLSDPADVEMDVLNGDQLLWFAWSGNTIEAAATTQLTTIKDKQVCTLTACGGSDMRRWLPLFSQIEQYAKNEGCCCVRIYGRRGWQRVLEGYQPKHVVLERAL